MEFLCLWASRNGGVRVSLICSQKSQSWIQIFHFLGRTSEACHPLLGAHLRFRFRFLAILRLRLRSGGGLVSAVLFALRDCFYAMSRESLALLFTDHRDFDARARIPLLRLEMEYANIDAGKLGILVYGKVDFGA